MQNGHSPRLHLSGRGGDLLRGPEPRNPDRSFPLGVGGFRSCLLPLAPSVAYERRAGARDGASSNASSSAVGRT